MTLVFSVSKSLAFQPRPRFLGSVLDSSVANTYAGFVNSSQVLERPAFSRVNFRAVFSSSKIFADGATAAESLEYLSSDQIRKNVGDELLTARPPGRADALICFSSNSLSGS